MKASGDALCLLVMKRSGWVEGAQNGCSHPPPSVGVLFGACLCPGTGAGGNGGLLLPLCFL